MLQPDRLDFPKPSVTVDLVLMSVRDGGLVVLLQRRAREPEAGKWVLPGGFVGIEEGLEAAVERILDAKARMEPTWLEQLYTFGAPGRDPRDRVITVAYFALLPERLFAAALERAPDLTLAEIHVPGASEMGAPVEVRDADGAALPLAFDHGEIIGLAVKRLRGKLDYSAVGFALLPKLFPLRDLQQVHEAILGVALNKPAFRRRMLDKGWLEPSGQRETGTVFRPAELYRAIAKSS